MRRMGAIQSHALQGWAKKPVRTCMLAGPLNSLCDNTMPFRFFSKGFAATPSPSILISARVGTHATPIASD